MGISEGYRRIAEKVASDWLHLQQRCEMAGLPPLDKRDFDGTHPVTRLGWECKKQLLVKEGRLGQTEQLEIARGLEMIRINERENEIRERLEAGADLPDFRWPDTSPSIPSAIALSSQASKVLRWTAIKELGLDKDTTYEWFYHGAMVEMYQIGKCRGDFKTDMSVTSSAERGEVNIRAPKAQAQSQHGSKT